MAWPTSNFPTALDVIVDQTANVDSADADDINGSYDCIEKIEAKVGVNNSAVVTSLDYLLKNAASENPGHKHTTQDYTVNHSDNIVQRPKLKDYGETVNAKGALGGGAVTIDLENGNVVTGTVDTAETTFTFSNPSAAGTACSFTLILTNGGSQTVNWPASVDWSGGTEPTLTVAGVDILSFLTVDGGTIWHGMIASLDSK
jgi:hypothetical protein